MKKNVGYTCQNEHCKITLKGRYQKFLDTHHIDGQKNNNHENNLKVLCVKCHSEEPMHAHMRQDSRYKEFIQIFHKR